MKNHTQPIKHSFRISRRNLLAFSLWAGLSLCGCSTAPDTSIADYIGVAAAKEAALEAASLSPDQVVMTSAGLEEKDGASYYEVVFTENNTEHTYEIDALTGIVTKENHSSMPAGTFAETLEQDADVSSDALEDAGLSADSQKEENPESLSQISSSQVSGSSDAPASPKAADSSAQEPVSKVSDSGLTPAAAAGSSAQSSQTLASGTTDSGRSSSTAAGSSVQNQTPGPDSSAQNPVPAAGSSTQTVDGDSALSIALSHAGLTRQDISFSNVKADMEDGQNVFEVEFTLPDGSEYDYEINASTGAVIKFDHDANTSHHHSSSRSGSHSGLISESQARQTVLSQVPGAGESDVSLHLESDDGHWEYEGWVIYNNAKYEFTIDAHTGALTEWEID